MKYFYCLPHLFIILLSCNTVFAAVSDEEFEALNRQVKSMKNTINRH
jgi:hypothetical protein